MDTDLSYIQTATEALTIARRRRERAKEVRGRVATAEADLYAYGRPADLIADAESLDSEAAAFEARAAELASGSRHAHASGEDMGDKVVKFMQARRMGRDPESSPAPASAGPDMGDAVVAHIKQRDRERGLVA